MKILNTTVLFLVLSFTAYSQKVSYYYTSVVSPDKTIDYVFGFYPSVSQYTETSGVKPYTYFKAAIINQKTAKAFDSRDDKIMILLKSGKLIRNYTTSAQTGDYAVKYSTQPGDTHVQYYCFDGRVDRNDISKVWYILGDTQIFELIFVEQ
ncbi:hypothetical protein A5893_01800 [Pedobacter psychrophilus]|uniref:DUF4488 domain-containing protein n=1 Tax=Pedobacter psychrophilus TaxID=1826909 RepID=A0A179DLA2_9SPHI|nr:hypothetical protein [Pedobacter psychrophilus]OAQ41877.1 hypothetical protein A5893_01800 [Pedobacter psychrophilus]